MKKREFIFRTWDNDEGRYYFPNECISLFGMELQPDGDRNITIEQFTGLKDKEGQNIFEGDILKLGDTCSFVVWCLDGWRFNSYMERGTMGLYPYIDRTNGKAIAEIIGNIHENPELLKPPKT